MTGKINVEVNADEWRGYEGLEAALGKAIETMKDSKLIRQVTRLMTAIDDEFRSWEQRESKIKDIKDDVQSLQNKVERL